MIWIVFSTYCVWLVMNRFNRDNIFENENLDTMKNLKKNSIIETFFPPPSTEMCHLSNNIYDYYNVSQGKVTIPNVDDGEECMLMDVSFEFQRIFPYLRQYTCTFDLFSLEMFRIRKFYMLFVHNDTRIKRNFPPQQTSDFSSFR